MKKSFIIYTVLSLVLACVMIFVYVNSNFDNEKVIRLESVVKELHIETKTLIEQKQDMTLMLALSLSKDTNVMQALRTNNSSLLSLNEITETYKKHTKFKDVWIHLVTKDGISFMKSWTHRKGESILDIRKDIVKFLKQPKVTPIISVGKYDMTIKAMVPIYDKEEFLGLFEVITKVNSIANQLSHDSIESVVLVDKIYKKQLRHAYTKIFIQDYYVANIDVNPLIMNFLKTVDIEKLLQNKQKYFILDNYFLTIYYLNDNNNNDMGYFLLFKELKSINLDDIYDKNIKFLFIWFFIIAIIIIVFFFILSKSYTKNLVKEVDVKTEELNELNKNLKIIVDNEIEKNRIIEAKLFQQQKLSQIGILFSNIAHHWRQPLSIITTSLSGLQVEIEYGLVTKDKINDGINKAIETATELSENIEFFISAYTEDEATSKLCFQELLDDCITIVEPLMNKANIKIQKHYSNENIYIEFSKNKFLDIIISILHNSRESLEQTQKEQKEINIFLDLREDIIITIKDNGKGIDEKILPLLFEPYTTSKHKSQGVGLSLFMARNIIMNELNGTIEAVNISQGAKIIIRIPQKINE